MQLSGLGWLAEVVVHTPFQAAFAVPSEGLGRRSDDRQAVGELTRSLGAGDFTGSPEATYPSENKSFNFSITQ